MSWYSSVVGAMAGSSDDQAPRLRSVQRVPPPYPLNDLPSAVLQSIGQSIVLSAFVFQRADFEGKDWEQTFAAAIGATWKPSNIGLDDIVLGNCGWGAKTIKATRVKSQKAVRLISGRNSVSYSYGSRNVAEMDPNILGQQIIGIWNTRVESVLQKYAHLRTVVLMKGPGLRELAVFELETHRFLPDRYKFVWNDRSNLEGRDETGRHCFTWQPHGSQFTIIEIVPRKRHIIELTQPELAPPAVADLLRLVNFQPDWIKISTQETERPNPSAS